MNTRRQFLIQAPILLGALSACKRTRAGPGRRSAAARPRPGAPPTFGTAPAVGPEVTPATFAEAEKLAQVTMTPAHRQMAAASWRRSMAAMLERRTGPRKIALEDGLAPATRWDPVLPGFSIGPSQNRFVRSRTDPGPLPASDDAIAFAPVTSLSRWIESQETHLRAAHRDLPVADRKYDPKLRCIITLTGDRALAAARQADKEIAAGKYRGPLHGIPFGVKDLLDTASIATTWGAEPFRNRVPATDSVGGGATPGGRGGAHRQA